MLSKTYILWMCLALAIGLWIPNLAPGTSMDSHFWYAMANPQGNYFCGFFTYPWFWLPSFVITLWPFDIQIPGIKLNIDKTAQFKLALWILLALISAPWCAGWLMYNPVSIICEIITLHQTPIIVHGTGFCDVCNHTLWEDLNGLLLALVHCIAYYFGICAAVRNVVKLCNFKSPWVLRYIQGNSNLYAVSCGYLILSMFFADLYGRFGSAEGYIHQGFH